MKNLLIPTILLSLATAKTSAQTVHTLSLAEAQAYAAENSYTLKQADIDVAISESQVKETTSIGLPQVNLEGTFNNFINIPVQVAPEDAFGFPDWINQTLVISAMQNGVDIPPQEPNPDGITEFQFGQKFSATAGLTASQLLFDGSYFVGLRASKNFLEYAKLNREKSLIELNNQIAQSYFTALAAAENIDALEQNMGNMAKILGETNAMYEAGFMEKLDADQVKLLKANMNNQLKMARSQRTNVLNLLKFQMGMPMTDSLELTETIESLIASTEANAITEQSMSLDNHIDFRTAAKGETLSELSLQRSKTAYMPRVSAFLTHSENAYRNEFDFFSGGSWYPTTLWGLQMNMPIFTSFGNRQRVEQAKLDLEKVRSQKKMVSESLQMQLTNAQLQYRVALDRYNIEKDNLALAKSIKETTLKKFNEGLSSSNDLTQNETQYLSTLGNYINATLQLLNAKLELDKAAGNI